MKKILPIFLILLSLGSTGQAQDIGNAMGMSMSPDSHKRHQDSEPKVQPQEDQQLSNKKLWVTNQLMQVKQWYKCQLSYLTINDGWHSAYATDNDLYLSPCSVNVIGGKATIIGNTNVSTSTIIESGRCQITAIGTDEKMHSLDIYFTQ